MKLLRLFLIFLCFNSFAQTDSTAFKLKKWLWSVEGHMQKCFRSCNSDMVAISHLGTFDMADYGGYYEESYNPKNDIWGFGYGAGFYGNVRLYKKFRLKFGVEYDHFQYNTKTIDVVYTKSTTVWGTTNGQYVNSMRINYELKSVSLLLKVHHYFKVSEGVF